MWSVWLTSSAELEWNRLAVITCRRKTDFHHSHGTVDVAPNSCQPLLVYANSIPRFLLSSRKVYPDIL